jgi:hypothetical protein
VGHIGQALRRKALAASKTLSFFHDSPHTGIRVIESLSHWVTELLGYWVIQLLGYWVIKSLSYSVIKS